MKPETTKGVGMIPFMSGNETLMQTVEPADSCGCRVRKSIPKGRWFDSLVASAYSLVYPRCTSVRSYIFLPTSIAAILYSCTILAVPIPCFDCRRWHRFSSYLF